MAAQEGIDREGSALTMPRGHWSDRGNCLLARGMAEHLAKTGWGLAEAGCPELPAP